MAVATAPSGTDYLVRVESARAWTFRLVRGAGSAEEASRVVTASFGPGCKVGRIEAMAARTDAEHAAIGIPPEYVIDARAT